MLDPGFWKDRSVFVTGHTGFKGTWLCAWLHQLGAHITGYALAPSGPQPLYSAFDFGEDVTSVLADIRDAKRLTAALREAQPSVVIHFAAQSLVLPSYVNPVETWSTNVIGSATLLQAITDAELNQCRIVFATTDKVYGTARDGTGLEETAPLGAADPYSTSKAACELLAQSWALSFFANQGQQISLVTARAGNVIGGGDWSDKRIVPDLVSALTLGRPLQLRAPQATRPWQHVLSCLYGYLLLAQSMDNPTISTAGSFNFGPVASDARTVGALVEDFISHWYSLPEGFVIELVSHTRTETLHLALNTQRSADLLNWSAVWDFEKTVQQTARWYFAQSKGENAADLCRADIATFTADLRNSAQGSTVGQGLGF